MTRAVIVANLSSSRCGPRGCPNHGSSGTDRFRLPFSHICLGRPQSARSRHLNQDTKVHTESTKGTGTCELKGPKQEGGTMGAGTNHLTNTSGRQLFRVLSSSHAQPIHATPCIWFVGFPPVAPQGRAGGSHVPSAISEQWPAVCSSRF